MRQAETITQTDMTRARTAASCHTTIAGHLEAQQGHDWSQGLTWVLLEEAETVRTQITCGIRNPHAHCLQASLLSRLAGVDVLLTRCRRFVKHMPPLYCANEH